jgi:CBS domain-containing protein
MTTRHVSDIMHHRRPMTARGSETVQRACQTMQAERVGAILVTDAEGHLEGIFTGRDAVRLLAEGRNPAQTRLDVVMTGNPETLPPDCTATQALHLMQDGGFRHVPVVEGRRLVGVVSRGDFGALEHASFDEQTGLWERL